MDLNLYLAILYGPYSSLPEMSLNCKYNSTYPKPVLSYRTFHVFWLQNYIQWKVVRVLV